MSKSEIHVIRAEIIRTDFKAMSRVLRNLFRFIWKHQFGGESPTCGQLSQNWGNRYVTKVYPARTLSVL